MADDPQSGTPAMLVFTRRIGEQIQIGESITVTVTRVDDQQVRIGIEAPQGVPIVRQELLRSQHSPEQPTAFDANRS